MQVGVAREDPQEHDSVVAYLNHLRDTRFGIVVTDDEITTLLEPDSRRGISDVGMGEATRVEDRTSRHGAGSREGHALLGPRTCLAAYRHP